METFGFACDKKIPFSAICWESDVNSLLGSSLTAPAGFHATRCNHQCRQLLFHTVTSAGCHQAKAPRILDVDNVVILHDNARPHVAIRTADKLRSFHWESLDHPPYSPDLVPSDFHVFGPLKEFLAGQRFTCNDKAKTAVRRWFHSQPDEFLFFSTP